MHLGDLNSLHNMGSIPTADSINIFTAMEGQDEGGCSNIEDKVVVSEFEYSVDKFFEVSEVISSLCGEQLLSINPNEIQHSSSKITFMEDWKHFYHEPKIVNFTYEADSPGLSKYAAEGIHLPQFSSVSVPKTSCLQTKEPSFGKAGKLNCDDFLLHAGGSIWALDWCPAVSKRSDSSKKYEYLAVSAHPPGSSYHQMGIPLSGSGIIQIWCILSAKEESLLDYNQLFNSSSRWRTGHSREKRFGLDPLGSIDGKTLPAKPRGRPRKQPIPVEHLSNSDGECLPSKPKRPRGRPRKQLDGEFQSSEPKRHRGRPRKKLDGEYMSSQPKRPRGRPRKQPESATRGRPRKQPVSATRGRPRKQPESAEFANVSSENDMPILTDFVCLPACGSEQDKDFRDAKANGVSVLKSGMNGNLKIESSAGLTFQEKSCPPKLGRESCKKMAGPLKFLDAKENGNELGESSFTVHASNEIDRNIHEESGLRFKTDEKISGLTLDDLRNGQRRSLTRPGRGRPRKKLAHGQLTDALSPSNCPPSQMELPLNGGYSHEKSGVRCEAVENLSTAMSHTPLNRRLGEDSLLFPDDVSSEVAREHHSTTVMKYNLDQVPQDFKESDIQNVDPENSTTRCTQKRKLNDKVREVTSISDASTFSKIKDGKQLRVHNNPSPVQNHGQASVSEVGHSRPLKMSYSDNHKNVTLPRVVLCLGHMGKVAWDIKWRPQSANMEDIHALGYLAAVLGDGSLEVWEVPLPGKVRILYHSYGKEGTDPRFIRIKPIFRCSALKCGDRKSIPLSVEWSPGCARDLILAGCHDGTVALWKFTTTDSSLDTKPLICFTADSVPIRAVAWAPDNSDTESAYLFVTAGNERLRFWDMRDPYHPLWDFNPVKRHILSVDWFKNPSCIMLSFDDGALRIISLSKATSGELLAGSKAKHHYYYCSAFPIWSVQISRVTGQVAYCGADGLTSRFQLTMKAVEKDSSRHREPHFLCGSVVDEDQHLCISIPFPGVPLEDTPRHGRSLHQDSNHARMETSNAAGDSIEVIPYSGHSQHNFGCKVSSQLKESNVEGGIPMEVTNLICSSGEKDEGNVQGRGIQVEPGGMKDVFPAKSMAMHKVRWNMNHGSERLLCYGGAAGIVRCQEVPLIGL